MREFSENQFGADRGGLPETDAAAPPHSVERRRHRRYAVEGDAEVVLADGSQFFRGRILDISLSGCFIETRARLNLPAGAPVSMIFRANGTMLRTAATVRALRPGQGAGFQFDGLSAHSRDGLEYLIATLEGVPGRDA